MKVRMGPLATRAGVMLQRNPVPASGWVTGQLMGRVWLVESLLPRTWPTPNPELELKSALELLKSDLLGVYFAHMEIPREEWTKGELVLRIQAEGIEASIFPPGDESAAEMKYYPVIFSGGVDVQRQIDGKG